MSDLRASFSSIDLSRLPAPTLVPRLTFEECRAAILLDFRARVPDFDALVASDPAIKLLEAAAFREMLLRATINDVGRATMLAFARGNDLEQLGALIGLRRLVLMPSTDSAPAIMESDTEFRARLQIAPEMLAGPGLTGGGYRGAVLGMAPALKDVAVLKRAGGRIDLVVLGREGDGVVDDAIVATLYAAFSGDAAAQLTDTVTVRSAGIRPWSASIEVSIRTGPDPELVRSNAEAAVRAYAADRHRIGQTVFAQMLEAAAAIGGVEQASVDIADVVPAEDEAAWLEELQVVVVGA